MRKMKIFAKLGLAFSFSTISLPFLSGKAVKHGFPLRCFKGGALNLHFQIRDLVKTISENLQSSLLYRGKSQRQQGVKTLSM